MKEIIKKVDKYYSDKIVEHGATSQGVDWNGIESHYLRFKQLCKIFSNNSDFTLLDFGCGFGSLCDYILENSIKCTYKGYDISEEMIKKAKETHPDDKLLFSTEIKSEAYDYTIANGIFNVKLDTPEDEWNTYILDTLRQINAISLKGFSFNILTSYSDKEYKKQYLYYADPLFYFDYCKKHFSKNVALLHDYNLYEFTILVRK
jgi:SAM-dependent methyltransferase